MTASWRATCIQMNSDCVADATSREDAWPRIAANVAAGVAAIDAACAGADKPKLVVMPEFAFTGAPRANPLPEWIEKACYPIPGAMTEPLQAAAIRHGLYIGGNLFETDEKWPGRYFNTCFLIAPSGEVILRFRRINTASFPSPHDFMSDYVAHHGWEGTFPVVETELGRIGMIACGEIAVPEVARALMLRGAEIILHPTNENNNPAQEAAKVARAAENMVYLVSANVSGPIGFSADGSELGGRSRIVDYMGRTLAYDESTAPSIGVSAMIDIEALRAARNSTSMANGLLRTRWEMYRELYAQVSIYPADQFLDRPMASTAELAPVVEKALANLRAAGIA